MRWAGAALVLLGVATFLSNGGAAGSNSTRKRKPRPWTQEQLALAGVVEGAEYEEDVVSTTPAVSACSACKVREEMKNLSLEIIKEQILSKLGLKRFPNATKWPEVPPVVMESYHKGTITVPGMVADQPVLQPDEEEEDDYHVKTEKVIAFAQRSNHSPSKLRHNKGRGQDVLYFRFSEKLTRNRVQRALLWVHVRGVGVVGPGPSMAGAPVTITVLRVLRGPEWTETPLSNIISSKVLRRNDPKGSWVSLDVRKLLEFWLQAPTDNLGIVIQASGPPDPLGRTLIVTDLNEADGQQVPFLEVYVADGKKRRTKRNLNYDCQENSEETRCCRYPLTVDFEAFGWDWIIAPKKYDANYCSGECPYVFLQKYPHTHVADMARPPGSAGPCCAPRKLSAISMLYFDPTLNIIYGLLPSMVVDRCGCS